jgi:hypothetical protein
MYSSTLSLTSALDGMGGRHTPAAFPQERHGTHYIGGWVGPRAGLDGFGKSLPDQNSIPGSSSPYSVAIATDLSHRRGRKLKSTSEIQTH